MPERPTDEKIIEDITGKIQLVVHMLNQPQLGIEAWNSALRSAQEAFVLGADRLSWTRQLFPWEQR